jgi:hypothetical protein
MNADTLVTRPTTSTASTASTPTVAPHARHRGSKLLLAVAAGAAVLVVGGGVATVAAWHHDATATPRPSTSAPSTPTGSVANGTSLAITQRTHKTGADAETHAYGARALVTPDGLPVAVALTAPNPTRHFYGARDAG